MHDIKLVGGPAIRKDDFITKLVHVCGHDGEEIPMTLMHKKGLPLNRKNRTLMEVYGNYGLNLQ